MRFSMILILAISVTLFGCHKKTQSEPGVHTGSPVCEGGYCPVPGTAITQTTAPVSTVDVAPPTQTPPVVTQPSGSIPTLPSDNSQIPSQVIVPAPKTIKK